MSLLFQTVQIDKNLSVPVYLQIANTIICRIRSGSLKPGAALPASRQLAAGLGVHRKTAIAAYDELYAQGWVNVVARKGIFVAHELPEISPQPMPNGSIVPSYPAHSHFELDQGLFPNGMSSLAKADQHLNFNDGFPDTRLAPVELLIREYRRFAGYQFTPKYLMYGPVCGSENLRTELAHFLAKTRGLNVRPQHIIITKGAQMALYLLSQVLFKPNDVIIVADPGFDGANEVFRHAGARVLCVPVDEQGMDLDAVEALCRQQPVRAIYVIPHHHMPTTVSLSPERRMRLLELARKHRFAIFEDDYDYDFHYSSSPILPLASADFSGSVVYIGSFCKTIAPGIRIGFVVAPPDLINQMAILRKMIDRQGEQLLEEAIANMLKNGDIGRHLKKMNKIYHERRDLLCRLLETEMAGKIRFRVPDGGLAIWVEYLNGVSPARVTAKALEMGLHVGSGEGYFADHSQQPFVRLGFASMNEQELREAVSILGRAFDRAAIELPGRP
ncbi:GntR family transcriptional regulator [Pedobacter yulinensis]|uniref:GntR family transcriptional regulator n=1 Tax=Pedobacter yulinensis TaxID=2126353 RepID=A0A2T3HI04_9SPHI|nr:PLP-dependent aminotransferase family protein [Pedobacter yulinensis]PST82086.1 GntR family transcriptional regulator [Pedobacter yulinensis]